MSETKGFISKMQAANQALQFGLKHATGTSTCGPFSNDMGDNTPMANICRTHDRGYETHLSENKGNPYGTWTDADERMLDDLYEIKNDRLGFRGRTTYNAALAFLKAKLKFTKPYASHSEMPSKRPHGVPEYKQRKRFKTRFEEEFEQKGYYPSAPFDKAGRQKYQRVSDMRYAPPSRRNRTRSGRKYYSGGHTYKKSKRGRRSFLQKRRARKYKPRLRRAPRAKGPSTRMLMNMLSPPTTIRGESFQNVPLGGNSVYLFDMDTEMGAHLTHGSRDRWFTVYKAFTGSTDFTGFDKNYQANWRYSRTIYELCNPGNFPLKIRMYEYTPKKAGQPIGAGLIFALNADLNISDRFVQSDTLNVETQILHTVTNPAATASPYTKMLIPSWYSPSSAGWEFKSKFKLLRSRSVTLQPGACFRHVQKNKYGLVRSARFDASGNGRVYNTGTTKLMLWRVEAPYLNDNTAASIPAGMPSTEVTIRISTMDVLSTGIGQYPKVKYINDDTSGANALAYTGPNGSTFTVSGAMTDNQAATNITSIFETNEIP